MSLTFSDIIKGLYEAGIETGDQLLVHSSLSSLGWVEGGAGAVIDALITEDQKRILSNQK